MARREDYKKVVKKAKKEKLVAKANENYKSRYKGELAPEKDIVEEFYSTSYKDNRYS